MARQLKEREAGYVIPDNKNVKEEVVTSIKEINLVFQNFYSELYTTEKLNKFFSKIKLNKISSDQVGELDAPISESEVKAAIRSMKPGKSPGLSGFLVEYYKKTHSYAGICSAVYSELLSQLYTFN